MIKKFIFLFAIAAAIMTTSCKKEGTTMPEAADAAANESSVPAEMPQTPVTAIPADGKYPILTFEKLEHDYGMINPTENVHYSFKFTNTGEADLLISKAVGSCGCTVPEFPKDPIKPGQSAQMKVSFNPSGKHGQQQKTVTVFTNTASGQEKLTIKASIKEAANS